MDARKAFMGKERRERPIGLAFALAFVDRLAIGVPTLPRVMIFRLHHSHCAAQPAILL